MRFITEFEQDGSSFDSSPAVFNLRKGHAEEKLGALISEAFEWEEKGATSLDPKATIKHVHKLEIEAFPMDKWVEFRDKIREYIVSGESDFTKVWLRILELESFGKPSKGDRIRNQGDSKCPHCNNPASSDFHQCPYKQDVHNDSISQCNCCDKCVNECAMDV